MSNLLKARPVLNEEDKLLRFSFAEIAVAMLKERKVFAGCWELGFAFGQTALKINDEQSGKTLPACMNYIQEIHLVRVPELTSKLAVDASKIGAIIVVGSI